MRRQLQLQADASESSGASPLELALASVRYVRRPLLPLEGDPLGGDLKFSCRDFDKRAQGALLKCEGHKTPSNVVYLLVVLGRNGRVLTQSLGWRERWTTCH